METAKHARARPGRRRARLLIVATALVAGLYGGWSHLASSSMSRGVSAYRRGDWSSALRLAEERLRVAKHDPEARRLLARASARLGRYPAAIEAYSGLPVNTLEPEDFFLLASGKSHAGQAVDGRRLLDLALASDPDHADSLDLFARLSLQTGRVSEAARAAHRLAAIPGREAQGDLLLGVIHATDQDPAGAAEAFRRALRRDPDIRVAPEDRFGTSRLLARALLQSGRAGEARATLRSVLDAGPDREAAWLLSRAYLLEGNGAEARSALAEAGGYRADHPLEPEPAPYLGEARCARCHPEVHDSVLASRHARTLRRGRELTELPLPDHPLIDPHNPDVRHSFRRDGERVWSETRVEDRVLRAVVVYALGSSDRYTSLVGSDEQARLRTLRLSYHRGVEGSGWDLTKAQKERPARTEDLLGEPFESEAQAHECLICHTTNPRALRDQTGPESDDHGIGCERCHGPGALHVAAVTARFSDRAIASPARTSPAEIGRLCGDCHSQHFLAMPAERTAPDWTRFPGSTLPWSRCYAESGGALSCMTCHDPHRNAETAPAHYEAKCLMCHAAPRGGAEPRDTQAAPGAKGAAIRSPCPVNPSRYCLACHMPKVRYDWLHGHFTDHYIRVHPRAESNVQGLPARGSTTGSRPSRSSQE